MPRGLAPRRPARTGRQDKVRGQRPVQKQAASNKNARVGTGAFARPARGKASAAASKGDKKLAPRPAAGKITTSRYNPIAPDRVAEILKRLDQLYPEVTCALTHASAWELVVATILSAQSTDVNVNRVTVVVDTHVHRISRRLELTTQNDPQKIEQDLMRILPKEKWILFAHQIIWHGRKLCIARKPKCADCALENICHAADKTWSTVDMHKNAKA